MRTTRETVSGKLVDFRKTRFHDSARQSEAESTNEKKLRPKWRDDVEGLWVDKLSYFNERTYHRNWLKLLHTSPLQATVEIG